MASVDDLMAEARRRPDDPMVWTQLGQGLLQAGRWDAAAEAFRNVCQLGGSADLLVMAGEGLEQLGDLSNAAFAYRRATRLEPKHIGAYGHLGDLLIRAGDGRAAALALRVAVSVAPNEPSLHVLLAKALEQSGQLAEAERCVEKAIQLRPDSAAYRLLARLAELRKQPDKAMEALRGLVEHDPNDLGAAASLGHALTRSGDLEGGLQLLQRVARSPDVPPEACVDLGRGFLLAKQQAPAIRALREAVRLRPRYAEAQYCLGQAYEMAGTRGEAIECYRAAIDFDPKLIDAYHRLSLLLHRDGDLREASNVLVRAAAADPKNEAIQKDLVRMMAEMSSPGPPASAASADAAGNLHGDLSFLKVPEMLDFLSNQRATGALVVTTKQSGEGRIQLEYGRVVTVQSPKSKPLAEALLTAGLVTRAGLRALLPPTKSERDDEAVLRALTNGPSVVDRQRLAEVLFDKSLRAMIELVGFSEGTIAFHATPEPSEPLDIEVLVDVRFLLLETMRTIDEGGG